MWIWFGRPIEPRPNWRQMNLPLAGAYGTTADQAAHAAALLAAHDPPLDVDELPGTLHHWYRHDQTWWAVVTYAHPVHGEDLGLSHYTDSIPADRLRPRTTEPTEPDV